MIGNVSLHATHSLNRLRLRLHATLRCISIAHFSVHKDLPENTLLFQCIRQLIRKCTFYIVWSLSLRTCSHFQSIFRHTKHLKTPMGKSELIFIESFCSGFLLLNCFKCILLCHSPIYHVHTYNECVCVLYF